MKDLSKVLMILLLGLMGGLCSKMNAQMCCGTFAFTLAADSAVISKTQKSIAKVSCKIMAFYSRKIFKGEKLRLGEEGYYLAGFWPWSELKIKIKLDCKQMTISVKELPAYTSQSYAILGLTFQKGNFAIDEKAYTVWLQENLKAEKEGMFRGHYLVPIQFLKPFQKEK